MSSEVPQLFAAAIRRLHAAMAQVANGKTSAIKALYAHADDATRFYGWGGFERGWDAVSQRWDWAGRQFQGGTVSYENVTTVVTAELAYTTDIETFVARVAGMQEPMTWSNRVTHVFRLENGEWRLLHRHANRFEAQFQPATRQVQTAQAMTARPSQRGCSPCHGPRGVGRAKLEHNRQL